MLFRFEIHVTDGNYLDYNRFTLLKSPYGKKQIRSFRLAIAAVALLCSLVVLSIDGFSAGSFLCVIPVWLVTLIFELSFPHALLRMVKRKMKQAKKQGKPLFTPDAVMEFYEDHLVEITEGGKIELKYTAIDSISLLADTTIYLHLNEMGAFLLPPATFLSHEAYRQFVAFLQTVNRRVCRYAPEN